MPFHHPTKTTHQRAYTLRHTPIEAETRLWSHLRANQLDGVHFRRQYAIGNYIVDFCAPQKRLIIELDGSQHLDSIPYDDQRSQYLYSKGYTVLRYRNNQVITEIDSIISEILIYLENNIKFNPPPASPK